MTCLQKNTFLMKAIIHETFYGPSTSGIGQEQSEQRASKLFETKRSKASLLGTVNVRKVAQLTPKAKLLYKEAVNFKRQLRTSKFRHAACKKRLEYAENYGKTELFTQNTTIIQKVVSRFFKSQLENASKKSKGKRFTEDDKVLALALFKQSGPAYRFLSDIFSLPSRHTLTNYLNKIPMHPGINEHVFEVLASQVKSLKKNTGKYCILMFDEMSICPSLSYDQKKDILLGFEDFGVRRTQKYANHVQVFMLRNIETKWKQPIYYNFVYGATHHPEIERILKLLIEKLAEIGFIVCATVCDQGQNNMSAIKHLVNDTKADYLRREEEMRGTFFKIGDTAVVPLFDPPHLLKGIRNNLLRKDLKCTIDGVDLIAKWDDIYKAYLIDPAFGEVRMMPKLTDFHVVPNLVKKMKVSSCTQVFSHAVSLAIHVMATSGTTHECNGEILQLKPRAKQTAKVIDFFDKLFDSVNGHVEVEVPGKNLRTCVTDKSDHLEFWKGAIKIFKTMVFIEKDDNDGTSDTDDANRNEGPIRGTTPPSIKNWITTLQGFIDIYSNMRVFGFKSMFPRTFNQDSLENFFGQVRQRGVRFTNPTVAAFTPFYKSLLVNNYSKRHSEGSNCENDDGDILVSLKKFVQQDVVEVQPVLHSNEDIKITEYLENRKDFEAIEIPNITGFVLKTVLPKLRNCECCKRNILAGDGVENRRLKNGSSMLIDYLTNIYNIFNHIFPIICHLENIIQRMAVIIRENVKFLFIDDCGHSKDMEDLIIKSFTRILILNNVKTLNNIMLGKDRRNFDRADAIYKNAEEIFKKSRKK